MNNENNNQYNNEARENHEGQSGHGQRRPYNRPKNYKYKPQHRNTHGRKPIQDRKAVTDKEKSGKPVPFKNPVKSVPRKPKGLAIIAEFGGEVQLKDTKKKREVIITNRETGDVKTYLIPYGSRLKVQEGQILEAGDELTEGSINPHDLLRIKGIRAVQDYMIREVQRVYRLQGVDINDKHVEVIVRQMLKKVRIEDGGDTGYLPGAMVDVLELEKRNKEMEEQGLQTATADQIMLGITKASLATDSFLSAASFQETTKVLTDAAIKGKVDPLVGLKENVILGKLIPAGTGMRRYRDVKISTDENDFTIGDEIDFDDEEFDIEE